MGELYGGSIGNLVAAADVQTFGGAWFFAPGACVLGFQSVAVNAGVVTLTLGPNSQIHSDDALVLATAEGTANAAIAHVDLVQGGRTIDVRMLDTSSALVEEAFHIIVLRKGA